MIILIYFLKIPKMSYPNTSNDLTLEQMALLIQLAMEESGLTSEFSPEELAQNPQFAAEALGLAPIDTSVNTQNDTQNDVQINTPTNTLINALNIDVAADIVGNYEINTNVFAEPQIEPTGETCSFTNNSEIQNNLEIQNNSEIMKHDPKRCGHTGCKRKISLISYPCKCGIVFCQIHRFGETSKERAARNNSSHYCSYDYQKEHLDRMVREMSGRNNQNHNRFNYNSNSGGNLAH